MLRSGVSVDICLSVSVFICLSVSSFVCLFIVMSDPLVTVSFMFSPPQKQTVLLKQVLFVSHSILFPGLCWQFLNGLWWNFVDGSASFGGFFCVFQCLPFGGNILFTRWQQHAWLRFEIFFFISLLLCCCSYSLVLLALLKLSLKLNCLLQPTTPRTNQHQESAFALQWQCGSSWHCIKLYLD